MNLAASNNNNNNNDIYYNYLLTSNFKKYNSIYTFQ